MIVFDIEGNGFLDKITQIYVLSYWDGDTITSLTDYDEMVDLLQGEDTLICHNLVMYDVPAIEKVLGIKIKSRLVDTLPLSQYLFPDRRLHGLESWGETFEVPKPPITDWENLDLEDYIHRCEEDVKINVKLWKNIEKKLSDLYATANPIDLPIIDYLTFKMKCVEAQYRSRWKLDKELCEKSLSKLLEEQAEKVEALKGVMPRIEKLVEKLPPSKPFKKDGTLSVQGALWNKLLREQGLTKGHNRPIYIPLKSVEPNPNAPQQIKDWLFSLGWEPEIYKETKNKDGVVKEVPQIKIPNTSDLCPSVLALAEENPSVLILEGLTIINHRIGVFKNLLKNVDEEGFVVAEVHGLTNTLRFKHKEPCVNLPGVDKPWGKEIRGSFVARDGYELCGVDIVQLEVTTKRHYMYAYDPDYADEIGKDDFDEHLDMALQCGALTYEQVLAHKAGTENFGKIRKEYKQVNFSGIYGIGAPKLSKAIKKPLKEAQELLQAYWKRNWSVKKIAEDQKIKRYKGEMWLVNPVNKFLYSLRYEKDKFSTLNQGTGSYVFDRFLKEVLKRRDQINAQFHDEGVFEIKLGNRERMISLLEESVEAVNKKLRLNAEVRIDYKFGKTYADIH